jgi:hypothetical protein
MALQEAVMASRHLFVQQIIVTAVTLPACARLAMLLGQADGRPCPVSLLSTLVTQLSRLAPDFASAALPALTPFLADPYCVSICLLRLLVSGWSLLRFLVQFV